MYSFVSEVTFACVKNSFFEYTWIVRNVLFVSSTRCRLFASVPTYSRRSRRKRRCPLLPRSREFTTYRSLSDPIASALGESSWSFEPPPLTTLDVVNTASPEMTQAEVILPTLLLLPTVTSTLPLESTAMSHKSESENDDKLLQEVRELLRVSLDVLALRLDRRGGLTHATQDLCDLKTDLGELNASGHSDPRARHEHVRHHDRGGLQHLHRAPLRLKSEGERSSGWACSCG